MSDEETRKERAKKFRNPVAKKLYENKGAFAIKVHDPRKQEYKREKLSPRDILESDDEIE